MTFNKGFIGGSTPLLLLSLLESKDLYGYEIIKTLEHKSDNTFSFKEGTLYPVLHKLENSGLLKSYRKEVDGRTRKYYSLTTKGLKQLSEEKAQWEKFSLAVSKIIGGEANAMA